MQVQPLAVMPLARAFLVKLPKVHGSHQGWRVGYPGRRRYWRLCVQVATLAQRLQPLVRIEVPQQV